MSNNNRDFSAIILAAGLGKRMGNAETPKALTKTCEMTFIEHQLQIIKELKLSKIVIVTGHKKELVEDQVNELRKRNELPEILFAHQAEQLGTGHAAKTGVLALNQTEGCSLILYGDVPLITKNTLTDLINKHLTDKATLTLLTLISTQQTNYGRIIRDKKSNKIIRITELKDCSPEEVIINELNPGVYIGKNSFLKESLDTLKNDNAQKEYYLTDIVEIASKADMKISAFSTTDSIEVQGVNTREELMIVNKELQRRKLTHFINQGVNFIDLDSVFISGDIRIGENVIIGPNVQLKGKITIADNVTIEGTAYLSNVTIGKDSLIKLGVRAEDCNIGEGCSIGPFAHLRPGTVLSNEVKIGNFVETKKAVIGKKTAVSHLTYLGDCNIGEDTNIGAGTITCNYDGFSKYETKIGNRVFVGSNTALVAPVTLADDSTIGAGSVITKDVQECTLAVTRPVLSIKENYIRRSKKDDKG